MLCKRVRVSLSVYSRKTMTTDFDLKLQSLNALLKTWNASFVELNLVVKVTNDTISELATALSVEHNDAESGV